jgi:hypothetical protein
MILTDLAADPDAFAKRTGWESKPEGLCRGEVCVPAPGARRADGRIDVKVAAERLRMPLVHDADHGLWALGPASGGHALTSAVAPDLRLPDVAGADFSLSSLRGRKVIMIAWASW